jgi:dienelactone hydrolase
MTWATRILAGLALAVVGWTLITALPAVVHGHPAYAVMLALAVAGSLWALWLHRGSRPPTQGWRRIGSYALLVGGLGWVVLIGLLKPFGAQEPALSAMQSDAGVQVSESATRIVLEPAGGSVAPAVFYQPGARVDARAYAAVLRPLAESGHRVVIVKQPLGIGFLATGAFDAVRDEHPDVTGWVLGGHSLGGTVAAEQANGSVADAVAPALGLLLHASYPASDLSRSLTVPVLSVSGTNDGLATPADIEASRVNLPADARFVEIDGAVHAFFGDYGPQPGDGEPTISHDEARTQISEATVGFVARVTAGAASP